MESYRCSNCNKNYPKMEDYRRCVKCGTPTASMSFQPTEVMSEEEAASFANQTAFRRHIDKETEAERTIRRDRALRAEQEERDRLARFPEVIAGAGFAEWELERLAHLERQLGGDHDQLGV